MKKIVSRPLNCKKIINTALSLALFAGSAYSQLPTPVPARTPSEDYTWWYVLLFILALGLIGAVGWWYNSKKLQTAAPKGVPPKKKSDEGEIDSYKELEWLRSNRDSIDRKKKRQPKKNFPENMPRASKAFDRDGNAEANTDADSKGFEDLQTLPLPIFNIQRLELARPFNNLPVSNDEALLSAIEQTHDEYEEDEEIRDLAVRILAAFKTRNSLEALSQVAHYDLSSNLRSKAVSALADFNHELVFEAILLACADPTREVRAAAARGLSRLSFDRADAWLRIAETGEEGRMRQAARAAIEGGFVERIFDRLVHRDQKQAFESVALLALLIKADETAPIFQKLDDDKNPQLQKAILHVIKITNHENALSGLYAMLDRKQMSADLKKEIDATIEAVGLVPV